MKVKIDIVTIFPKMVEAGLAEGVVGRARDAGLLDIVVHNLRDFTTDRHHVVDDVPFGGGPGMVMKPEPLFAAVEAIRERRGTPDAVLLTVAGGRAFTQADARRLAALGHFVVLCGRYEGHRRARRSAGDRRGVDRRLRALGRRAAGAGDRRCGGRLVPGVVGDEQSVEGDSFTRGLLDYPHYTRPAEFGGQRVPDVLVSGHHGEIRRWRREQALRRTVERRPELLARRGARRGRTRVVAGQRRNGREGVSHGRHRAGGKGAADRAAADEGGRHGPRARAGQGRRQRAHPDLRGRDHQPAPRRRARARSRCARCRSARASSASSRCTRRSFEGGRRAIGQGPPRQAVFPARAEGQGGAHEGSEEDYRRQCAQSAYSAYRCLGERRSARDGRSRTRSGATASWRGRRRRSRPRLPGRPGDGRRRRARSRSAHPRAGGLEGADGSRARSAVRRDLSQVRAWAVSSVEPAEIDASTSTRRRCGRCSARCWRWPPCRMRCWWMPSAFRRCRWRSAA